jgi:2-polyprenyl-6-methoxyphenol hydroxylase-like FAD-dependent oxidoreductase
MKSEDILVIGAGPAGLAVSASLRREGLKHVVLAAAPSRHTPATRKALIVDIVVSGRQMGKDPSFGVSGNSPTLVINS